MWSSSLGKAILWESLKYRLLETKREYKSLVPGIVYHPEEIGAS
jgi:hypothetical protein